MKTSEVWCLFSKENSWRNTCRLNMLTRNIADSKVQQTFQQWQCTVYAYGVFLCFLYMCYFSLQVSDQSLVKIRKWLQMGGGKYSLIIEWAAAANLLFNIQLWKRSLFMFHLFEDNKRGWWSVSKMSPSPCFLRTTGTN